jgi:hypothetical protein
MLKMLEKNPKSFMKVYIEGVPMGINRGMALGTEIHKALENEVDTGHEVNDLTISQLVKYEINDKQFLIDIPVGDEIIPIRIQPDTLRTDWSEFRDRKTGQGPWTRKIVDNDSQLEFYATAIYTKTGKIPKAWIDWMPTHKVTGEDGVERPELTGEIFRFERDFTLKQILRMKLRMRDAWRLAGKLTEEALSI